MGPNERLSVFVRSELAPNPGRVRAFLRLEVGLVLASFVIITFKPVNGYWTMVYLLLVSVPTVGNSLLDAVHRTQTSLIGCGVAFLLIIGAYDQAWLFAPLQAIGLGVALSIARSTPVGPAALTGGATFAIITGSDVTQLPANLVSLGFYRILQAVIGSGLGAFVQLVCWPDDPLAALRHSLAVQTEQVAASLRDEPALPDASRVGRHFELLANAEVRHPGLRRRRSEIGALILDVACLVDAVVGRRRLPAPPPSDPLTERLAAAEQRLGSAELFAPPPPPPPAPRAPWREAMHETTRMARRATMKLAASAFIALLISQLCGLPAGGALFVALAVSMQVSSGTAISKSLLVVAGLLLALIVVLVIVVPFMPNLDDPGSFLLLAAVAFAPLAWLTIAGPRVRNAGLFGSVVVAVSLTEDYRPAVDLERPWRFALTLAIGALVVGAVDRVVWPVDARRGMVARAVSMMRDVAALYREPDPLVILEPNRRSRWRAHRHLVALVQLRSEHLPLPGEARYALEEEVLQIAATTQRLVVARIEEARGELRGVFAPEAEADRRAIAARLEERAAALERNPVS